MSKSHTATELKKIQELCHILHDLHITTFFQLRIFRTGKFLVLTNSLPIYSASESEQFVDNYFFQLIENSRHGVININLWPSYSTDQFLTRLNDLTIRHGISIYYALDDYIDIFSFATNQPKEKIQNIYLNNLSLLKRFIVYFRSKSKKILERKAVQRFPLSKQLILSTMLSHDNLSNLSRFKIKLIGYYIETTISKLNKKTTLTKKEMECLSHLLTGKSIKIVAEQLNVSRKRVEACLKNLRIKTGFYTKDQLISLFNQDLLIMEIS